ncbi:maltase A2-like [Uloborus diversus]|uniref:maltase A2-like n=1 Tax=Uloborus diversus TaxID=327109 RepID=UPI00240A0925|nr:maltase A2-like [Uloborus diversus]
MDKDNEQAPCNGEQHDDQVDNMDEDAAAKEKLTSDPNKVKFTSVDLDGYDGKNGEAKVDIQLSHTTVGMGKDELMKYANEPFWVKLRMFLFVGFWLLWIAMLVGAVVIIILAPRCPPAPRLDWYQKTSMYEVDVEAFKDSDEDGIGDFKGLISKLDYFKTQNIGTLILSAFYKLSDDAVVDHRDIEPKLGTLTDFEELLVEMNKKDLKVVIDFNPNYSSAKHKWFEQSENSEPAYKDFYIWADEESPPNDWKSTDGESAWKWNDKRSQYYLATYGEGKPDYNLRNAVVREELKDTLRFWLEKGVSGFRVLGAPHLLVKESEEVKNQNEDKYTINQFEYLNLFKEWREILKNFTVSSGTQKILLADVPVSLGTNTVQAGNETVTLVELPISTQLTNLKEDTSASDLEKQIKMLPENSWSAILLGSKSLKRLATRVGDLLDGIHMVSFLAKGTPITYYGDELGLTDLPGEKTQSKITMPWNDDASGGFTNGTNALSLHPDYAKINVKAQENEKQSHLNIYKKLLALRGQPALSFGKQEYPVITNDIFSMIRVRKGSPGYMVVLNTGTNTTVIDFSNKNPHLPEMAHVEIRSHNLLSGPLAEGDRPKVQLSQITLEPKQSIVFTFVPLFEG